MTGRWIHDSPRWTLGGALALVLALTGWAWLDPRTGPGGWLARRSYDGLFALMPSRAGLLASSPVVVVYLDLDSHHREGQDPTRPWDRSIHARLLNRLSAAGARGVVFDILFGGAGPSPEADAALASAIRASGKVILAAELNRTSRSTGDAADVKARSLALPFKPFLEAAAGWGLAYSRADEDFVVRAYFPGYLAEDEPSLTWAATRLPGVVATERSTSESRWLNYYGPPFTVPHVSYSDALDPATVPDAFFRDRVVLVGARPAAGLFDERLDELRSPFTGWGEADAFLPGVEVHATALLNLVRGDWLRRASHPVETAWVVFSALATVGVLFRFRPLPALALALVLSGLTAAVAVFLASAHQVWFPWWIPAGIHVPVALAGSVASQSLDWYRQRRRYLARIQEQAALIREARDAILVRDLDRAITFMNPSAERLYGWTLDELANPSVRARLFRDRDDRLAEAERATQERGEWNGELDQVTADGRAIVVLSRWTLIRDADGEPRGVLIINTDVTDRKQLEQQFLRVQRMETIGSLAGGMAHDLNNALAPILMGVQLLRRRSPDPDTDHMLAVMESNTHRGADMVRQVLLLARGRGAEREVVQLPVVLGEVERILRHTLPKSIHVAVMAPPDVWPVLGNATQLHQVILNLCVNARDAMPKGGELTLALDNVDLGDAESAAVPGTTPGDWVLILVSDTGTGIPPELLPRVFEPFVTTKPAGSGTGLGLPTVARIVRNHGGVVHVRSEPGAGTTFEIHLPRARIGPAPAAVDSPEPRPTGHGEWILLVDDEESVRELIGATLRDAGYRVLAAANGMEALLRMDERPGDIRLALVDADMPWIEGTDLISVLRNKFPTLAMVLMSGQSDPGPLDERARSLGARFLVKPFDADALVRRVSEALGSPPAGT